MAPSTEERHDAAGLPAAPMSPLRRRLIEDMNMRRFARENQRNYVCDVGRFATFLGAPARYRNRPGRAPLPGRGEGRGYDGADH